MASTEPQPTSDKTTSPREDALRLADGSLGDLLRAEREWRSGANSGDKGWANFFDAAKKEKLTRYASQWDDEAVDENQIISDYARGLQTGEYDDSMRPFVAAIVREKGKRTDARGTDILATIGTAVTSLPQVAKELGVSGVEIGKTLGETAAGYGAMAYGGLTGDEYLAEAGREMGTKAGARTAIAAEGETKETLGFYRRSFPRVYDFLRSMAQSGGTPSGVIDVARSLAGYGGASILAKNRKAGLAGDDEAFETYFDTRLDEEMDIQAARLGRGELTKMIGADVDSLKRIGIEFTQEDIDRATAMAPLLDATELLEAATGIGLASSATRKLAAAAVKRAGFEAAGDVLLTAAERGIPTQRVLSRTIKTAEQVAEEARQYDTLLRKARLASGEKLVKLGQTIKKLPIPAGSPLLVAGGVLAGGGDTQDALTAGILAGAGRYVLGSRFGVRTVGAAVEGTGKVLSKKFAVNSPWEAARRSMIDLRRDMTLGAAGGMSAAGLTILDPALSPESRGTLLSSGFLMGGGGVAGAKMMDAISYGMNFAPRLSTPDSINGEAVLPRGYADVGADRVNGQAFKKLSEDSTIFLRSLQDYLGNDGVVMVATTPEEYAELANSRVKSGNAGVAGSQGVAFKPEDTISGKAEVILDLSRGVNNSPGHEVTHAVMNVIEAGGGPLAEKLQAAKFAVINDFGGVNSEGFKAIKAKYEEALGREISNDAVVDEWLAEHGSVILAGLPLGKFPGVNKGVVSNLYDTFLTFSETLRGRVDPYSPTAGAPVTSSVLQYTPSVSMLNMLENIFAAYKYEKEAIIKEAKPAKSAQEVEDAVKQQDAAVVDVGVATPVPAELTVVNEVPVKGSISGIPAEEKPKTPVKKAPTPVAEEAPAPVAEKAPAPKPQEGIYTPESKRRKLAGDQSPPEVLDENRRILDEELNKPRAERVPLQAEYNSADVEEAESLRAFEEGKQTDKLGLTQPQRLEQRRLADAGQKSGVTNALRSLYDKVFIPMSAAGSDNVFGFSIDKVIRNIDMLSQWLSENPDVANQILDEAGYQSLSDPAFVRDFQAYLQNQANGYRGDGRDIVLPEGTDPTLVTEPTPGYEPKMLSERAAQLINSVMGVRNVTDWGAGAPLNKVFAIRLAELNGVPMVEQISGVGKGGRQLRPKAEFNTMNKMLRDAGFDTNLFHVALENLRISRMGEKPLVRRPDLKNIKAPVTSYIQAGFMPAQAAKTSPGNPQAQESKKRTASMAVRSVAEDYMREAGLPYTPHEKYAPVNEDLAKRLADFYDQAESAPDDPEVQSAYRSLADETMAQYRAMEAAGIEIEPWEGKGEPYANSAEMLKDVRDNKHLWFFTTESGFGKGETAPNALLEDSGVVVNGKPLVVNDVFRAVHDYFGHAKEGYEFGPRGEFNAYLAHSRMFSDAAKPALASETLAQNSWVNFGPHLRREDGSLPKSGEEGFVSIKDRPFADQKNLVIPDELLAEADQVAGQFMPAERAGEPLESERLASMPARILVDDLPESPNYEVVPKGDPDPLGYGGSGGKFYLSPDGRWLAVEDHELAAEELLPGREKPRNKSENPSQEELELRLGWVRVLDEGSALNDGATLYFTSQANPTQIRELRNVAIEYGRELIQDFGGRERTLYRPERGAQFMPSERAGKPLESEGLEVGRTIETDAERVFGEGEAEPQFMPAPPVESEAFKKWFGNSKVVDENGVPLVVYHGTENATFDEFKTDRGYEFGPAAYFTPEAARAARYAGMNRAENMAAEPGATVEDIEGEMPKFGSPAVYPVYVSIQNPISAADFEQLPGNTNAARNAEARRQGYDGVIKTWPANQFRPEEIVEVAAFEPTQVKSATGNRGTYDPTNPDIRFMPAPPVESEAFKNWFGNSKIVDNRGNPKVVYHGTRKNFTEFKADPNAPDVNILGNGFYFTTDREYATLYGKPMASFVSLKNPYIIGKSPKLTEGFGGETFRSAVEAAGYDGIIDYTWLNQAPPKRGVGDTTNVHIVAFKPTQIKSATDNVGTYDPTNPDIRYMPAPPVKSEAFKRWAGGKRVYEADQIDPNNLPRSGIFKVYHGTKQDFTEFKARFSDGLLFTTPNPEFAYEWGRNRGLNGRTPRNYPDEVYKQSQADAEKLRPTIEWNNNDPASIKAWSDYFDSPEYKAPRLGRATADTSILPLWANVEKAFDPTKEYKLVEPIVRQMEGGAQLIAKGDHKVGNWIVYENQPMINFLKEKGYDAIWLSESSIDPKHETLAVFSPNQLKSATGNVGTYDPTNPDIRYMPAKELTTQFESTKKRGSLGGVQQLVHFSSVPMKTLNPEKSSGKGAATPTDLRGMKRGYFYRLKKGAYESGIADRPYTYMAQVDGNSIYDLAKDPLGYRGIPDREKADRMLIDAGFAGMRGKVGAIDMVAMFKPVKVTEATAEDVYTKKQLAEQRRQRAPLEEEEIDYQAEDEAWEAEKARRWPAGQFMPAPMNPDIRYTPTRLSTVDIRRGEETLDLPNKPLVSQIGSALAKRSRKILRAPYDSRTKQTKEAMATTLADELEYAMTEDESAIGWYERKIAEAMELLAQKHPELANDIDLSAFYKAVLAITSNGQAVIENFARADKLYEHWKDTGRLITDSNWGGKQARAINGGLAALQKLVDLKGLNGTREFLLGRYRFGDLKRLAEQEFGLSISGEKADYITHGSIIFGPKVGGGFFPNLNGDFSPVTMDMWLMRTWNRINGSFGQPDQTSMGRALAEIREAAASNPELPQSAEISRLSDRQLANWMEKTYTDWKSRRKFKDATVFDRPSKRFVEAKEGRIEAPRNASERAWVREIFSRVDEILTERGLPKINNADKQALLWYYEKELYASLGYRDKRGAPADYADAARSLLSNQ